METLNQGGGCRMGLQSSGGVESLSFRVLAKRSALSQKEMNTVRKQKGSPGLLTTDTWLSMDQLPSRCPRLMFLDSRPSAASRELGSAQVA